MEPYELLLPECWEIIFKSVENPQDWLNLYRTSSHFEDIVGADRTTALFPHVLPNLIDYLDLTEITNCRLVSPSWKRVVDKLLENLGSVNIHFERQLRAFYHLKTNTHLSSFVEQFRTHPGNPFLGRFLLLKFDYMLSTPTIDEYNLLADRLLDKFGPHLRTLRIELCECYENSVNKLQSYIQFVPNIHSLQIHRFNSELGRSLRGGDDERIPIIDVVPGLSPLLENLKWISFTGSGARESLLGFQNAMLAICCSRAGSLRSVDAIGLPSELLNYSRLDSVNTTLDLNDCPAMLQAQAGELSKLGVHYYNCFNDRPHSLFDFVEKFSTTLTELNFKCPLLHNVSFNRRLESPLLKQLTIIYHSKITLDFLLNLANLEVLKICNHYPLANERQAGHALFCAIEIVDAEITRCNLWENLSKLTKIILVGHPFREGERRREFVISAISVRSRLEFQRQPIRRC